MNSKPVILLCLSIILLMGCSDSNNSVQIKNEKKGKLKATVVLAEVAVKKFDLDSASAPKPLYIQMYTDGNGKRQLTFLNNYSNSIYFYDYETLKFIKKITFNKPKPAIQPIAYHIRSPDSIYIYNKAGLELLQINGNGDITHKISLIGGENIRKGRWMLSYPQYDLQTIIPFFETSTELIFPGQYINSIPDTLVDKFHFLAHLNFKTAKMRYTQTYPLSLYGFNYNWEGQVFTQVYADMPASNKLVCSFPVAHNLYIGDPNAAGYKVVYGGSNEAGVISSIPKSPRKTLREMIISHFIRNDEYGAIKYDKYQKVYYRFLRKAMPNAPDNTPWKAKPVTVIIMDENFNYLGEQSIGTGEKWHLENAFVTSEGLNIEYVANGLNEDQLVFKIFNLKKK